MKRAPFLFGAVVLAIVYLLPKLSLEKIKIFEIEINISKIEIDTKYIGMMLLFFVIIILLTYFRDWNDLSAEPMPSSDKNALSAGWTQDDSQAAAHKAIRKHRINVALFLLVNVVPATFVTLVACLFLWHFVTGR